MAFYENMLVPTMSYHLKYVSIGIRNLLKQFVFFSRKVGYNQEVQNYKIMFTYLFFTNPTILYCFIPSQDNKCLCLSHAHSSQPEIRSKRLSTWNQCPRGMSSVITLQNVMGYAWWLKWFQYDDVCCCANWKIT